MGSGANNFPPEAFMDIGTPIITSSRLGNTAAFPATVFFTAPNTGIYQFGGIIHVTQTDKAGTLGITVNAPTGIQGSASGPVTQDNVPNNMIALLTAGAQVTCTVTATGLGNTTFDVYLSAVRIF